MVPQFFLKSTIFINMYKKLKKLLRNKLLLEFFDVKLDDEEKEFSNRYRGRMVDWYGYPSQMIVIHKNFVTGMWGNIYDNEKLKYVVDLLRNSEDNVEFQCSYGLGELTNFTDILEEQKSYKNGDFNLDYDGHESPSTTGYDELDDYVGTEDIEDLEFISINVSQMEIIEFFKEHQFGLIYNQVKIEELRDKFSILNPDEYEIDALDEFLRLEIELFNAQLNDDGDFNNFKVQLRDGHHRVFGAIEAGENYICLNLDKESIKKFRGHYQLVN